jgi:hypothetical protein
LSRHCESRSFTDDSTVVVHHGSESSNKGGDGSDSATDIFVPRKDPRVLWINTRGEDVGIKFKVKRRKQQASNVPLLYSSDVELAVSYVVEFEGKGRRSQRQRLECAYWHITEVFIRTAHILFKLEEAEKQLSNDTGKAIVFGTFRVAA